MASSLTSVSRLEATIWKVMQESNIIRLVHYTAQEYFERICMTQFPDAQTSVATACLVYISFDAFAEGYYRSNWEMESRMHKYPLGMLSNTGVIIHAETQTRQSKSGF
jgi:hypothetical protein